MTNFKCKVCGKIVDGVGPENKWRCSKCNNKVLIGKLMACHTEGLGDDINFSRQNKTLLNRVKSFKRFRP